MALVLIVDDDSAVLRLFYRHVEAQGHQVIGATNGSEARAILDSTPVDLIVADLRMPGLDGLGLLAHVRSLSPAVPVILVSGAWTPDARARAQLLGCSCLREKPVDLAQLVKDIDELVP